MKGGSLFAGIGGLDLGAERAGIDVILQVEIDDYCRCVLAKHWPNVRRIADVRDVRRDDLEGIDILFGGFPCQPVSIAGIRKSKGESDERWLWGEFLRCIYISRPRYIVIENVKALLFRRGGGLEHTLIEGILFDLAVCGYDVEWSLVSACSVGAPHMRQRVFIIAYLNSQRIAWSSFKKIPRFSAFCWNKNGRSITDVQRRSGISKSLIRRKSYGISRRLDTLGNAVVPQVAEYVFSQIMQFERSICES